MKTDNVSFGKTLDDLAERVMNGVKGNETAIKAVGDAIATFDRSKIRDAIRNHAKIEISEDQLNLLVSSLNTATPSQKAAYFS